MGFLGTWLEGMRIGSDRSPVSTAAALRDTLSAQAAFVAQKVVTEYCQAKAGRNWPQLSSEATFVADLARSRWEAFAILLADVFLIAESLIRPDSRDLDPAAERRLVALYAEALAAYPRPAHRPGGWDDRVTAFAARLAAAGRAPPAVTRDIVAVGGRAVFGVLPIHINMRRLDGPMVTNAIAFQMAAVAGRLRRRLDRATLVAALGTEGSETGGGSETPGWRASGSAS
ncbi:hypothetical protein [Stella sp.]|uniref:hypothetical protein n=1 Tax=Stella sp. TaxID=2912054 RepID=UPI0035B181ED